MRVATVSTPWRRFQARFIGDRRFYQTVLALIVPIIIQNTVSNIVNLLDNVMVGALGTAHMSGVAMIRSWPSNRYGVFCFLVYAFASYWVPLWLSVRAPLPGFTIQKRKCVA